MMLQSPALHSVCTDPFPNLHTHTHTRTRTVNCTTLPGIIISTHLPILWPSSSYKCITMKVNICPPCYKHLGVQFKVNLSNNINPQHYVIVALNIWMNFISHFCPAAMCRVAGNLVEVYVVLVKEKSAMKPSKISQVHFLQLFGVFFILLWISG